MVPVRSRVNPKEYFAAIDKNLSLLKASDMTADSMVDDESQMVALETIYKRTGAMAPSGPYLERYLHLPQAFIIVPLFAFFNAGVSLGEGVVETVSNNISLGIILGLVLGKPIGIVLFSWLAVRLSGSGLPGGITWPQICGVGLLAGIGFTMSLFITELAFKDYEVITEAKIGILVASLIAGVCGYLLLQKSLPRSA